MMLLGYLLPVAAAKTGEAAKAGPIGLAVIILLCIACYFLFKSMAKHMRRVRDNFPDGFPGEQPRDKPVELSKERPSDEQQPRER